MIEEISIRNLGVIGDARLPLGPGFTAVTGETGAGKTMVVTALGLLLGDRSDSAMLRQGASSAVVEGHWQIDPAGAVAERVLDAGGEIDEGELILGRSISSEGRSRATVGGRTTPVGVLSEIGEQLVVVHGQSDQVRLRSATAQREALDRFSGTELASVLAEYQQTYRRWQGNQGELDVLVAERDRRAAEAEELRAAMAEIEAVAPRAGEDDELAERAERLSNLEDLRLAAAQAHELIATESPDETPDAVTLLETARRQLERAAEHDPALSGISSSLAEASFLVSDVAVQLSSYLGTLDTDGSRELEIVQERRADLAGIARKYGPSLTEAIDYLETGSSRLLELDNDSERIEGLEHEVEADRAKVLELAEQLSALRRGSAIRLSDEVTAELAALAMPDARIVVDVADRSEYSLSGKDVVSILLAPHPGAEPRPLGRGASGGELSRVMLAIEVVIAGSDPVATFIFDEVDAGVGGASAIEIGRRLARLSRSAQVIVVTHLAQVAAFSTNHLRVVKDSSGTVTASSVQQLRGEQRIEEMARLLSGLPDSQSGLAHARELIETARALDQ
ncbi:DNA repair protein RecN [Lacisediminihabitans changchengi]|uniref:DNA repair protein RecN n=1 Tax=Lacisediminihabitans changchengi TaxID=2787634 RepID=A0A934SLP2_9MICO|nr:DNA repair protein RecN [Lacisediminihabitans changchengi]MBK4347651.1 DNA repair protein RecN [Lacisediminihabitans changchengi]